MKSPLKSIFVCFAILVLGLSACGTQNQATCQEECAQVNTLECTADDFLDCDVQCPESWDQGGLDYGDYITCVYGQYSCNADSGDYEFTSSACTVPN